MADKIINTFQQRRQLSIDVADMAHTDSQQSLIQAAMNIVDSYPEAMIQVELLKCLDTPDSQLRGGLGHLAELLPRENIAPALRSIAADRTQSDQNRITATMILSHFLGESVPQPLLRGLSQGDDVAYQSLLEAVHEGRKNRHVLLEYVLQMREAGDHVPPLVMDMMERLPAADRVELLRLIALDDRKAVAVNALSRLEQLAVDSDSSEALRALHILQFMLPPYLTPYAENALRRLRFRGRTFNPPEATDWRALMSIADIGGGYTIWFVHARPSVADGGPKDDEYLYVNLNELTGSVLAAYATDSSTSGLPAYKHHGAALTINMDGVDVLFLEAPFDYARWRVLQTASAMWDKTDELPPEYRLYGDILWQYARPQVETELQRFFLTDAVEEPEGTDFGQEAAAVLLGHPAIQHWIQFNRSLIQLPADLAAPDSSETRTQLIHAFLSQIAQHTESESIVEGIAEGMRNMAAWFLIAGYYDAAEAARQVSLTIAQLPVSRNPLLTAIVEAEFDSRSVLSQPR